MYHQRGQSYKNKKFLLPSITESDYQTEYIFQKYQLWMKNKKVAVSCSDRPQFVKVDNCYLFLQIWTLIYTHYRHSQFTTMKQEYLENEQLPAVMIKEQNSGIVQTQDELELLLKQCQKEFIHCTDSHIKHVIIFAPWNLEVEQKKVSNSISTKTGTTHPTKIDHPIDQNQDHPQTRAKGKHQHNYAEPQDEIQPQPQEQVNVEINKTRFRQMGRRRRVVGPQPESFRSQLQKIIQLEKARIQANYIKEKQSSIKEQQYASNQESTVSEVVFGSKQKRRKSPLDDFLSTLPSIKYPEQTIVIPQGQICKHNLEAIFENASLNILQAIYTVEPNEDPFFFTAFEHFRSELAYKASNQRSSHHLSKGRLFMVRRAMELYSHIEPKEHNQLRFIRNRLTKKQKAAFSKAKLPCPPCRLTTGFLEELFGVPNFVPFFKQFVHSGDLEKILGQRSQKQIDNFRVFYKQVSSYEVKEERMNVLNVNPAPLSHLEINLYLEEAHALCDRYCK